MNICILGSGRGSNCQAILQSFQDQKEKNSKISAVFSDNEDARILNIAFSHGIDAKYLPSGESSCRLDPSLEKGWIEQIQSYNPDFLVLAGFMRILSESFVNTWPNSILNIHPSLLPSFPGTKTHERALEAGVKVSGCTLHFVTAELDAGPIIGQAAVPVLDNDTPKTLANRVLKEEHKLYVLGLELVANKILQNKKIALHSEKSTISKSLLNF